MQLNVFKNIFSEKKQLKSQVQTLTRQMKNMRYGYDAARVSRWTNDFLTELGTINREIKSDIRAVRVRARSLWKNSSIVRAYRKRLISDVVGRDGFKLQMRVKDSKGDTDKIANQKIEAAWDEWSKEDTCSMKGDRNLTQVCYQYIESRKRDGEFICRFIEDDSVNKFGFSLELIEPDLLDDQLNVDLPNGNVIIMGIEIDKWKKPVNYYFKKNTIQDELIGTYSYFDTMSNHIKIPARDILHRYNPEHSNQIRGISELAPVMIDLHNLKGLDESSIIAARVGASASQVIERTEETQTEDDDDENTENYKTEPLSYGERIYLEPNEKMSSWTPIYPNEVYGIFVKFHLRRVAVALGVNYNSLLSDLEGVNFSSMRSGLLMERDQWFVDQNDIIVSFLIPVFERWLQRVQFVSLLQKEKALDLSYDPEHYNKPEFFGRNYAWVDPYKDVQATVLALNNNLTSYTRECKKQGLDFDDLIEERKLENEKMKAAGIIPSNEVKVKPTAKPVKDDDDEPDEEDSFLIDSYSEIIDKHISAIEVDNNGKRRVEYHKHNGNGKH